MTIRRRKVLLQVFGAVSLLLLTLGPWVVTEVPTAAAPPPQKQINLALMLSTPGRSDLSWSFMHWLGAQRAKDLGYVANLRIVASTPATALSDLTVAVKSRLFDLIYVASFSTFGTALKELANRYPDQHYAISDIRPDFKDDDPGNAAVLGLLYQQEQPSAVAGALAAALALQYDCPHVGIVLGREIPVLHEFEMGYKWGVDWAVEHLRKANPDFVQGKRLFRTPRKARVLWTYTGAFNDPARGREATEAQVRQGACVVYAVAGATGLGVLRFMDDYHRDTNIPIGRPPFAIGVDTVQEWISPHVVGSALKRADEAVLMAVRLVREGRFREVVGKERSLWLNFGNRGTWFSDPAMVREWVQRAVEIGELDAAKARQVMADYDRLRRAQPAWVWELVERLRQLIVRGQVDIPRPFGDPRRWPIDKLREQYG
jgi:basic membrane protein A